MSKREIQVEEKLSLLQTLPLSLQHLFAMFGATVLVGTKWIDVVFPAAAMGGRHFSEPGF